MPTDVTQTLLTASMPQQPENASPPVLDSIRKDPRSLLLVIRKAHGIQEVHNVPYLGFQSAESILRIVQDKIGLRKRSKMVQMLRLRKNVVCTASVSTSTDRAADSPGGMTILQDASPNRRLTQGLRNPSTLTSASAQEVFNHIDALVIKWETDRKLVASSLAVLHVGLLVTGVLASSGVI